jgi:hypothetical protein
MAKQIYTYTHTHTRTRTHAHARTLARSHARARAQTVHNQCKIWGVHGNDYEGCRLLGYKNPVRTSQETHYVSAIEPNRLMLCKI